MVIYSDSLCRVTPTHYAELLRTVEEGLGVGAAGREVRPFDFAQGHIVPFGVLTLLILGRMPFIRLASMPRAFIVRLVTTATMRPESAE